MTQRFTVEMQRTDLLTTTLEVVAKDIALASRQAMRVTSANPKVWNTERGPVIIKKITAHANKRGTV